jgi:hypothetical protein
MEAGRHSRCSQGEEVEAEGLLVEAEAEADLRRTHPEKQHKLLLNKLSLSDNCSERFPLSGCS